MYTNLINDNPIFKEAFEKWSTNDLVLKKEAVEFFYDELTPSMQYGTIVDFFDSVGIHICIAYGSRTFYWLVHLDTNKTESVLEYELRSDARVAAIVQAIEMLESKS